MLAVRDAFDALLLGCFIFGLLFAAATLLGGLGGALHFHVHLHMPVRLGHVRLGHRAPAPGRGRNVGPLNSSSMLVFISWFGGWAYLARNGLDWVLAASLIAGLVGGLVGATVVFLWLAKVLMRMDGELDPADYRLPGILARVTSSIRVGGVGEIVYEQGGVRQVSAARSLDGCAIPRGTEVVIRDRERGIASVEPWDSFLGDRHADVNWPTTDRIRQPAGEPSKPRSPERPHDSGDAWVNRPPMELPPPAA